MARPRRVGAAAFGARAAARLGRAGMGTGAARVRVWSAAEAARPKFQTFASRFNSGLSGTGRRALRARSANPFWIKPSPSAPSCLAAARRTNGSTAPGAKAVYSAAFPRFESGTNSRRRRLGLCIQTPPDGRTRRGRLDTRRQKHSGPEGIRPPSGGLWCTAGKDPSGSQRYLAQAPVPR